MDQAYMKMRPTSVHEMDNLVDMQSTSQALANPKMIKIVHECTKRVTYFVSTHRLEAAKSQKDFSNYHVIN